MSTRSKYDHYGYPMRHLVPENIQGQLHIIISGISMSEWDPAAEQKRIDATKWLADNVPEGTYTTNYNMMVEMYAGPMLEIVPSPVYLAVAFEDADHAALFKLTWGSA